VAAEGLTCGAGEGRTAAVVAEEEDAHDAVRDEEESASLIESLFQGEWLWVKVLTGGAVRCCCFPTV
jgi:hypothetical protein